MLTYGDVAPGRRADPRDVGRVLLQHGDELPWWRVLRAGGTPAAGHRPHLRERQLASLQQEGTPIAPWDDAVDLRLARWSAARMDRPPTVFDISAPYAISTTDCIRC